ncbi:MAG: hypothetical protein MJ240_01700 [Kiritimatiellae bacterium]|nr:hypothetical protein [Kiritimatiellia bacterium]
MATALTPGWDNVNPARRPVDPVQVVWHADFKQGRDCFKVQTFDGAEGGAEVIETGDGPALRIFKTNDVGYLTVEPKARFTVAEGTELQAFAYVSGETNDPEYCYGFLRLYGKTKSLAYFSGLDGRGPGGPMMSMLFNTTKGTPIRKLCRYLANAKTGCDVMPVIVVAGPKSDSVWHKWGVEDLKAAKANWAKFLKKVETPDHADDMQDETAFDAALAADVDHTAKVISRDGYAALAVDGQIVPPMIYKGKVPNTGKNTYCGRKMEENGVRVQVITTRFGDSPEVHGFWTPAGYDAQGAAAEIKRAMRMAPQSVFILTLIMDAYPEFIEEHPEEVWTVEDGRPVWGQQVHANYSLDPKTFRNRHWKWVSYHSLVWREAVKRNIDALVRELRQQGLAKRIIGVHLGGYHDHQFATRHPDYSKPAVAAFQARQMRLFNKVRWAVAPRFPDADFLVPGRDDAQIAYYEFLKVGPFEMLEDLAMHLKAAFAKDIIAVRWCMGAFGGTFCSAYDITAFANSKAIDVIAPQPDYARRIPGIGIGQRLPSATFHRKGKLFLNELDLRTYGAVSGGETELRVTGLSQATDDAMWQSTYRKVAGMMLADRHGWWFYDMAGGWFEPEGIAADIADSVKTVKRLSAVPARPFVRSAALVVDEKGALLRNTVHPRHYYNFDEERLFGTQLQLLASSGVPYDILLMDDVLSDPELARRYRTLVFMGMYEVDAARKELLARLKSENRTLVFLAATGVVGGGLETGFDIAYGTNGVSHAIVPEPGVDVNLTSFTEHAPKAKLLGCKLGGHWLPRRDAVRSGDGVRALGRYAADGSIAVAERRERDWKGVFIGSAAGLTSQLFNRLVKESGGYVPVEYGVQVNMNGNFVSLHCTIPGHYAFALPFACSVRNLKTGTVEAVTANSLSLDLQAGETRWYLLESK